MRSHRPFILSHILSHIFSCILSFLYLISLLFLSLLIFSFCNALHLVEKENNKTSLHRSIRPFMSFASDWQITLLRPYSFHIKNRKTWVSSSLSIWIQQKADTKHPRQMPVPAFLIHSLFQSFDISCTRIVKNRTGVWITTTDLMWINLLTGVTYVEIQALQKIWDSSLQKTIQKKALRRYDDEPFSHRFMYALFLTRDQT